MVLAYHHKASTGIRLKAEYPVGPSKSCAFQLNSPLPPLMNSQSTLCCVSAAVITSSYPCSISFSCLLIIPHLTFPIPVLCIAFSALTLPFIPVGLVFPHLTFPTYSIVRNYLFSCISTWSSCSNAQRLFTPLSPHFMCLPQKLGQSRASEMQASSLH